MFVLLVFLLYLIWGDLQRISKKYKSCAQNNTYTSNNNIYTDHNNNLQIHMSIISLNSTQYFMIITYIH